MRRRITGLEDEDEYSGDEANPKFGDPDDPELVDSTDYDFSDEIYERHAEIIDRLNAIDESLKRLERLIEKK